MAEDLLRKPDERTGLAIMGNDPIILPEQRKKLADRVKDTLDME